MEGEHTACILQVSWDARDGSYTAEQLREIFRAHGPVADVVIRQAKKKSKGSAFVEMGTLEAAAAAARAHNGRPEMPLLVVPFSKVRAPQVLDLHTSTLSMLFREAVTTRQRPPWH